MPVVGGAQDGRPVRSAHSGKGRGTGGGSVWTGVVVRQRLMCLFDAVYLEV